MIPAVRNLLDRNSTYDCEYFIQDLTTGFSCCVLCDADEVETRFCSCKRSNRNKYDYCDCGYHGEEAMKEPDHLQRDAIKRKIRWAWVIQAIFGIVLGGILITNPEAFSFHVVLSNSNVKGLTTDGYRQFQENAAHAKEPVAKPKEVGITELISQMNVGGIFSKIMDNEATTETEKDVFIKTLDDVSREMTLEAAKSSIATPTKFAGGPWLFFGIFSLIQRSNPIELTSSISTVSMLWNGCMIISLASAASGASGSFITFMIFFCSISLVFWFYVRDRVIHMQLAGKANDKDDEDEDEIIDT